MSMEFPPAERAETSIEERHRNWLESAKIWGGAVVGGALVVGAEAIGFAAFRELSTHLMRAEAIGPATIAGGASILLFATAVKDAVRLACTTVGIDTEWRQNSEEYFNKKES